MVQNTLEASLHEKNPGETFCKLPAKATMPFYKLYTRQAFVHEHASQTAPPAAEPATQRNT